MTMVSCGMFDWPRVEIKPSIFSSGGALTTLTLDSTTDMVAWVGTSPIADSITVVYFRTGTIAAGGGDTVDVRIETVTNGKPSGTLWAANTNIAVAVADADDNVWKTATLTASASLAVGDMFAIVIRSSSGTPAVTITTVTSTLGASSGHLPTIVQNATGADAVIADTVLEWVVKFNSAGIRYLPGLSPLDGAFTLTAFNSGSAPNARALRFQVPFKCRVVGARLMMGNFAAGSDFTVSLFDGAGTTDAGALGQFTVDGDFAQSATIDGLLEGYFDAVNTLAANTTYYVEVRPDTANSITLWEETTAGSGEPAGAIRAFSHMSAEVYLATRTWAAGTAGAWSTTTTTMPVITLLVDQLDDGTGIITSVAPLFGGAVL